MKKRNFLMVCLLVMAIVSLSAAVSCKKKQPTSESPKVTTYTVSFDTMGGNEIPSVQVEEGKCIEEPEDPIREGYNFNCWFYDFKEFDFSTPVNGDMELIANWSAKTDVAYSISVFVEIDGEYQDKTADYTSYFGVMKATTGQTVNVSNVATQILATLSGYYLDTNNKNCVVESQIAANGSTKFSLYYAQLEAEGNTLACYTNSVTGDGYTAVLSNDAGYVREGEQAVLKITTNKALTELELNVTPEVKDWSSYDYISFYVYNASNASYATASGCNVYRNDWNLIVIDLHETDLGDLSNVEKFTDKILCSWILVESGISINENSVFYVSNIVGNTYKTGYTEADNVVYKMEEEVGVITKYWTMMAADYYHLTYETVKIGNDTRNMTKVNIDLPASDIKYHALWLPKLTSNDTTIRGFSFDVYNENDFAIFIAGNEIPAKTLKTITVRRSQVEYFAQSDASYMLYALDENDEFLPMGASFYIGNIKRNPIGEDMVNYSVKVYVQNGLGGAYEDKSSEFNFGDCSVNEFSEVDVELKAEALAPQNHYLDTTHESSVTHVFEVVEGTQFVVYYTYTDAVVPNYYRVEGRGRLSVNYNIYYDEEGYSYKVYDTNCWTDETNEGTALYFTDEAWEAYEAALVENPDITKIVFYVMEPTCGLVNCAGQCRLLDREEKDGIWDIFRRPLYKDLFSRIELTVEQFTKICNGYGYYIDFACWADGHYVYLSGLYFE